MVQVSGTIADQMPRFRAVWISSFILFHAATTNHVSAAMVARSVIKLSISDIAHESCRFSDRSLEILEHLAQRGSVWPEACGAAIRDLQTQMTLRASGELTDACPTRHKESPGRSLIRGSECAGVPSDTSPHIIARTPSQASIPSRQVLGEKLAVDTSGDEDRASVENADSQSAPGRRRSEEPYKPFRAQKGSVVDSGAQPYPPETKDSAPSDPSQSSFGPDQLFQFSSNDEQDPFSGFDIPFWLGQDQYSGMVNEWS